MENENKPYWQDKHFSYFQNPECEYFPCHEKGSADDFNCLFCYCPLYALGKNCGGNYKYLENGIKDCSNCLLPHKRDNYGYVTEKFSELCSRMKEIEK